MYIYRGKFNWFDYAVNEAITIVFATDFGIGEPVSALWQWTKDATGKEKVNVTHNGVIDSVTLERKIGFFYDRYYKFDGTIGADLESLTLTMRNPSGDTSAAFVLKLSYSEPPFTPRCLVYTGKLDWFDYAKNEMFTVVVPSSFNSGDTICLYWQWTVDANGQKKANRDFVGPMKIKAVNVAGARTLSIPADYYTFDGEVTGGRNSITLTMSNPGGDRSNTITLNLANDLMSRKKALIARYNVGVDGGISAVSNLLTDTLGFSPSNVEMLYYDVESKTEPSQTLNGQKAPTAKRFRERFVALIQDTKPGDVRFLYVDAHGMPIETNDPGEHGRDEGWKFAQDEDGLKAEIVPDNWIADMLQQHLKPGANMTILCTSCLGSGMLDTHRGAPGVLLSACYETQLNVKAMKRGDIKDPWTYAIWRVIRNAVTRKRRMPSHSELFNQARLRIRNLLASHELESNTYKGPSPDPGNPIPWQEGSELASYQDPQLIFNGWYVNPDRVRFLDPFYVPASQSLSPPHDDGPTRYPHDEL